MKPLPAVLPGMTWAEDGALTNPVRTTFPGDTFNDGMAFDAEGALWDRLRISNRLIRVARI